ncbi:MAG TPA: ABC transporter permease, partial [Bryobacteraceae bacterium]|nr:ABC transporter permease [Bryobacteraceae bacterium]
MHSFWSRVLATLRRSRAERDLEAELQFHLAMQEEENLGRGMSAEEARYEARRSFGGVERTKEDYRDRRGFRLLDNARQDLRFGLRMLRRNPGFTLTAVLTLALGIGATTAVFSIVHAVVLRPLPFPESARLMAVLSAYPGAREAFSSAQGVYLDWRERATSFESLAGARITEMILSGGEQARHVRVIAASYDLPALLGTRPLLGRSFRPEEDWEGQGAVALLDAGFWRNEFGGSNNILGRTLVLDGRAYTVAGILPEQIRSTPFGTAEVWVPLCAKRAMRAGGDVIAVGRLRPGVARQSAQVEMDAIMRQIGREHLQDSQTRVIVKPLQDWIVGDARRNLLVLLGAAGFVLLIACANIATLTLVRATLRNKEMATRAALGAARGRLVAQILIENVTLALIGGALGVALAFGLLQALPAIRAFPIPRIEEVVMDRTALLVAAAASMASGILSGLAASPLRRAGGMRLRNALVAAQLALAVVLMSGAALMSNTLVRLLRIDLGFERERVVTVAMELPQQKYDARRAVEFGRRLAADVRRIPGILRASVTDFPPLQPVLFPYEVRAEGSRRERTVEALARNVDPGYFAALGIPLLAGRDFVLEDDIRRPVPVLINRTLANALFGQEAPVGKVMLAAYYRDRPRLEVVGVVGDSHQLSLTGQPGLQLYLPLVYGPPRYVVARTAPGAGDLAVPIRSAARALDRDVPAPEIGTLDDAHSREIARPRFYLGLLASFASVGLVLAVVG